MDGMSIVYSSLNAQSAYMAKSHLEAAGIEVFMQDELTTQIYNCGASLGGVKIFVREEDVKVSLIVLTECGLITPKEELETLTKSDVSDPETCPYCHSKNIKLSKKPRVNRLISLILMLITATSAAINNDQINECFDCRKRWYYK